MSNSLRGANSGSSLKAETERDPRQVIGWDRGRARK